ncbi:MAG: hypothetical protein ABIR66_02235 [Saprospiraceae bacterium]
MNREKTQINEVLELKIARGIDRKSLTQIPAVARTKAFQKNYQVKSKGSLALLQVAKKSLGGTWKASKQQVADIAHKYHFNVPTEDKPTKKLGTTGITLYRKGPGHYFLIKRQRNI